MRTGFSDGVQVADGNDDVQRCVVMNSSVMTCRMPEVRLPSDFRVNETVDESVAAAGGGVASLSGGPDGRDRADVYVGLVFDGFRDYANLTAAMPDVTMQFYQPPTFDTSIDSANDVIVYRPTSFKDIDIKVRLALLLVQTFVGGMFSRVALKKRLLYRCSAKFFSLLLLLMVMLSADFNGVTAWLIVV